MAAVSRQCRSLSGAAVLGSSGAPPPRCRRSRGAAGVRGSFCEARVARGGASGRARCAPGAGERAGAGFLGSRTSWANKTGGRAVALLLPRGARSGAAAGPGADGARQPWRRARRSGGVGRAAGGRQRGAPGRCHPQAVLRRAGEAARQLRGAGHGEVTSPAPLGSRPRPTGSCRLSPCRGPRRAAGSPRCPRLRPWAPPAGLVCVSVSLRPSPPGQTGKGTREEVPGGSWAPPPPQSGSSASIPVALRPPSPALPVLRGCAAFLGCWRHLFEGPQPRSSRVCVAAVAGLVSYEPAVVGDCHRTISQP